MEQQTPIPPNQGWSRPKGKTAPFSCPWFFFFFLGGGGCGGSRFSIYFVQHCSLIWIMHEDRIKLNTKHKHINFEKFMEINFALVNMYPQNTYVRLIRSSGMGNCLFLHAQGWWVDHQEQKKMQIQGVWLRGHANRSNCNHMRRWPHCWKSKQLL